MHHPSLPLALALAGASLLGSCTIVDSHTTSDPTAFHMHGLVDGYAAFGMAESRGLLRLGVLDGPNHGSIVNFNLANLFAIDAGIVGASLTLGPVHLGLGTLFYDPEPPYIDSDDESDD